IPLEDNGPVFEFAARLTRGEIGAVLFTTGVGSETLLQALQTKGLADEFIQALSQRTVIARGPKTVASLSKLGIRVDIRAAEPNTWREVAAAIDASRTELSGCTVAVQEYGTSNQ